MCTGTHITAKKDIAAFDSAFFISRRQFLLKFFNASIFSSRPHSPESLVPRFCPFDHNSATPHFFYGLFTDKTDYSEVKALEKNFRYSEDLLHQKYAKENLKKKFVILVFFFSSEQNPVSLSAKPGSQEKIWTFNEKKSVNHSLYQFLKIDKNKEKKFASVRLSVQKKKSGKSSKIIFQRVCRYPFSHTT